MKIVQSREKLRLQNYKKEPALQEKECTHLVPLPNACVKKSKRRIMYGLWTILMAEVGWLMSEDAGQSREMRQHSQETRQTAQVKKSMNSVR